jgi:hypothetical protein
MESDFSVAAGLIPRVLLTNVGQGHKKYQTMNDLLKGVSSRDLKAAARDFRYLLNRGYPRKGALELVGNRYQLTSDARHLLHRGVFSETDAKSRNLKLVQMKDLRDQDVAIDGYNVLITLEAGLSGRPLIAADDGWIRDISGLSSSFRKTPTTEHAFVLILQTLRRVKPRHVLFLFDSPISRSGSLAQEVRSLLAKDKFSGDARAVKVPEQILMGFQGIVATSDTAIIDRCEKVVDLAGFILKHRCQVYTIDIA